MPTKLLVRAILLASLAWLWLCVSFVVPLPPAYAAAPLQTPVDLLALTWLVWRLLLLDRTWHTWRAWRVSPAPWVLAATASPCLTDGLLLGEAFAWTTAQTQALETFLVDEETLPVATSARGGHPALHAVGAGAVQLLPLPWSELVGQVGVLGTTRSGKSTLLELLMTHAIRARHGPVMVLDPRGSRTLLARCALEAFRTQRPFAVIAPAFPAQSATMNVLDTATSPVEVSSRINALMPSGGGRTTDPFFEQYPLALIERIATAQQALGQPWTLEGLYKASVLPQHAERLLMDYLVHLGCTRTPTLQPMKTEYFRKHMHDLTADALIADQERNRDHFAKVTANLIPAFRGVVGLPLGRLFSAVPADLTWQTIVEKEIVVYVALASMLLGDIANRIGRVILQDLIGYLGRRDAYADVRAAVPITVLIDEVGDVVFPLFTNALNKGGGAKARFVIAMQSHADLDAKVGREESRRIRDNLNTQVTFRLTDDRTATDVAEGYGVCTVQMPETGVGLAVGGGGGLTGSAHRRLVQREVPRVRPDWLKALPRGEAFVRLKGEVHKLRVPMLAPVTSDELDMLGLTTLWNSLAPQPISSPTEGSDVCDDSVVSC